MGYKQIIVVRKDLNMSVGKICAQVSHASMAFLTNMIKANSKLCSVYDDDDTYLRDDYWCEFWTDKDLYEQWINGSFTKVVLKAKNKNQLLKAKAMVEDMNMVEGKDFFLIKDNCLTELEPEEVDENGVGRTLTCIGFKLMDSEIIDKIGKRYHLYK